MTLVSLAILEEKSDDNLLFIKEFNNAKGRLDEFESNLFDLSLDPISNTRNNDTHIPSTGSSFPQKQSLWNNCSLRHQFLMQSMLERMNHKLSTANTTLNDEMWIGCLGTAEEFRYYGYITSTKKKVIVAVEDDDILPDEEDLQSIKDINVKTLLSQIHTLISNYQMNPFNTKGGKINSKRFSRGVDLLVDEFNSY